LHQALIKVLNEGTFSLKAREVPAFLEVYRWVQALPDKINQKSEIIKDAKQLGGQTKKTRPKVRRGRD
jgi:hypothetical protein